MYELFQLFSTCVPASVHVPSGFHPSKELHDSSTHLPHFLHPFAILLPSWNFPSIVQTFFICPFSLHFPQLFINVLISLLGPFASNFL